MRDITDINIIHTTPEGVQFPRESAYISVKSYAGMRYNICVILCMYLVYQLLKAPLPGMAVIEKYSIKLVRQYC